jgi:hypothetical protein
VRLLTPTPLLAILFNWRIDLFYKSITGRLEVIFDMALRKNDKKHVDYLLALNISPLKA